jgi:multidrug efflux pump subunit AcrB
VFTWEPGVMWRENRDYAITVQGDIVEGLQGATVTAEELLPKLRELEAGWHAAGQGGYRIEVAGAVEESSKGSASIVAGVPIMLFLVFTLLMLQLHSFSRSLLVFITGPLGIAGVAGALLLLNRPFGFVALLGVIALMGMIQRNAVILIDQIESDRAARRAGLGRDRRVGGAAAAAHRADGRGGGAGDDPAVAQRVLGADGRGHHGRADRGDRADPAGAAGDVRRLVPCQAGAKSRSD